MEKGKKIRLSKAAREFNISQQTLVEYLKKHGIRVKDDPNEKLDSKAYALLEKRFGKEKKFKEELEKVKSQEKDKPHSLSLNDLKKEPEEEETGSESNIFITDASSGSTIAVEKEDIPEETEEVKEEKDKEKQEPQNGPKVLGKINLDEIDNSTRPKKKSQAKKKEKKEKIKDKPSVDDVVAEIEQITKQVDKEVKEEEKAAAENKEKLEKKKAEEKEASTPKEEVKQKETPVQEEVKEEPQKEDEKQKGLKIVGKIDLKDIEEKKKPQKPQRPQKNKKKKEQNKQQRDESNKENENKKKKKGKKRIEKVDIEKEAKRIKKKPSRKKKKDYVLDDQEIEKQYKETLQQVAGRQGVKSIQKQRYEKRKKDKEKKLERELADETRTKRLTITEFTTVGQLARLMEVDEIEVLSKALQLGIRATVNFPLEADDIELIAGEFGFEVEFIDVVDQEVLETQYEDKEEDLEPRPPIVTVMGHVDHGKTSLLDYIRNTNVIAGEAGGITQHIGAYHVELDDGRKITFIDTPGHEAFTAMRARGAKVTDIAVIVVAADDGVRPTTLEALDHAKVAGVPIIFAINKIDKPTADPEKVRNELAQHGYLVSSWGGKYEDVEISAKKGTNVDELLETILLVAEDLNLKANPNRPAVGTVLEASVEKGRGTVTNLLVRTGTLKVGDIVLAGSHYGKVRAMFNERMKRIKEAGPSMPAQILGLDGTPDPGEPFAVMESEKEAKQKANAREQIKRAMERKARQMLTLEEISRRLQVGEFSEINVVLRADVSGTAETLAEELEKLSTDEVKVRVIRKAVGQITESDVLLASVSNAIIIGFQVRPSAQARKLAEQKEVEIRLYSVIYDAINEMKDAILGMLKPIVKEEYLGTAKVLKIFKIKGVGTVAGCQVEQGKITRDAYIRLIRDGVVVYEGELSTLKRYQEDVNEVKAPQECGISIKNFNDIKRGDNIEAVKKVEIERTL